MTWLLGSLFVCVFDQPIHVVTQARILMGNRVEISLVVRDTVSGNEIINYAFEEMEALENKISSWKPSSQISKINDQADKSAVKIDQEVWQLLYRAKKISELTNGVFDITWKSMGNIWKFDGQELFDIPDTVDVKVAIANIGYEKLILDRDQSTAFLTDPNMKIDLGAIGKGFAADQIHQKLKKQGVESGIINAGGDLKVWGMDAIPDEIKSQWKIGILNPNKSDLHSWVNTGNFAVATSGNYEKYFTIAGDKYSHIVDPRTGFPCIGMKSVTIFCPNAELADGIATAVFVLGVNDGLSLINQLKGIETVLIDYDSKTHYSNGIEPKELD